MHVAMVLRQFSPFGGLELYAFELVKGLLERGLRVTVICEKDDTNFQHDRLSVVTFASPSKSSSKADKIEHYYREASRAVANSGPFDLVHSQHFPIDCADVVTFHNHTIHRLTEVGQRWEQLLNLFKTNFSQAYKLREQHDKELCHRARCLIFPAKVCAEDFKRYGIADKHIAIAHPGARDAGIAYPGAQDSGTVHPGARNSELADPGAQDSRVDHPEASRIPVHQGSDFNFLFVGKGFRKKGLDILLQACGILAKRNKRFKLHIAGLRLKPFDKMRLNMLGLAEHVEYLGFQKDMDAVFRKAACIVLPSRIEPFGMAPIEGMLRGLVPIVSRPCGVAEVLTDEKDSLILEDHLKVQELAALMEKLIDKPEITQRLSEAALASSRQLTWDRTVESTMSAYDAISATPSLT